MVEGEGVEGEEGSEGEGGGGGGVVVDSSTVNHLSRNTDAPLRNQTNCRNIMFNNLQL